jgi:opacity protein-like surface antigen
LASLAVLAVSAAAAAMPHQAHAKETITFAAASFAWQGRQDARLAG